jgi:hypothetical protein
VKSRKRNRSLPKNWESVGILDAIKPKKSPHHITTTVLNNWWGNWWADLHLHLLTQENGKLLPPWWPGDPNKPPTLPPARPPMPYPPQLPPIPPPIPPPVVPPKPPIKPGPAIAYAALGAELAFILVGVANAYGKVAILEMKDKLNKFKAKVVGDPNLSSEEKLRLIQEINNDLAEMTKQYDELEDQFEKNPMIRLGKWLGLK